ncbi:MAG: hypothetical protein AAF802_19610 [Planctomycetota bacterium]
MLGDYKLNRCTRQCFAEERPLREGEWYYSAVLVDEDETLVRRDYSADAWQGPPDGSVGHWKSRMPIAGEKKLVLAPRGVLIDLLRQVGTAETEMEVGELPDAGQSQRIRFLLALLLIRRKYVKLLSDPEPDAAPRDDARKVLNIDLGDGATIEVVQCEIPKGEMEQLSGQLSELLYCEASSDGLEE